ncbi:MULTISPECIES: hypothetical protein [unclassified Pseudoalteromonas]|uniref:hypothetical protein n=1 Tax=unclassified Pseudoalteromonas TaxID=194690 RepID=UPI003014973D
MSTKIGVDILGNVKSITQKGRSWVDSVEVIAVETRKYDAHQQLCLIMRPDVGNTVLKYNALGQVVWKKEGVSNTQCTTTKPAGATSYKYDNLGDIHQFNPPSGTPPVTYTRDNNGNVISLAAGKVTHTYGYTNQDLIKSEKLTISGQSPIRVAYGYNGLQHKTYTQYPDQSKVYYSPNGYGEPTKAVEIDKSGSIVNKFATEAKYYAHGMLESFTFGNNATHSMSIDPISLMPKTIKDTLNNNDVVNLTYGFDNNGNVTKIIDMV